MDHEQAYGNVLARLLNHRVSNFGVIAYGTDQAYLRFKYNASDDAKIVILHHLSENVIRNVGQLRNLPYPTTGPLLAPRFILTQTGALQLVPPPRLDPAEYRDCMHHPNRYLKHDYFLPGGPSGVREFTFPYTLSVLRVVNHFRFQANLKGEPWWADFYRPDHPAKGLQVTLAIIRAFVRDAEEMGKVPVVVILPFGLNLAYKRQHNTWTYQPLLDELAAAKIRHFDAGAYIDEIWSGRDLRRLYTHGNLGWHPNAEGYEVQAQGVYRYLAERGIACRGTGQGTVQR